MSLSEEIEEESASFHRGPECSVRVLLETLPPKDAQELVEVMARPTSQIMHSAIAKVLARRNHRVPPDAISRHRRGVCGCAR
jgi:hypothetical protein